MCYACFVCFGSPTTVTTRAIQASKLIAELYTHNPVGGNLHIVTDDWNIDNDQVFYCKQEITAIKKGLPPEYAFCDPVTVEIEYKILTLMEPMSEDERAVTLALHDKFIDEQGNKIFPLV